MTYRAKSKQSQPFSNLQRADQYPALSPLATAVKVAIVGLSLAHSTSQAATITVDSTADEFENGSSNCTLRESITSMDRGFEFSGCVVTGDAFGINDTINFDASLSGETITLSGVRSELSVNSRSSLLTIDASDINGITVSAEAGRIMRLNRAALSIDSVNFVGGNALLFTDPAEGGAIRVNQDSTLIIKNCTISDNTAGSGGAIVVSNNSSVSMSNCTMSGNRAIGSSTSISNLTSGNGGAIAVLGGSSFTVSDSTFSGNSAADNSLGYYDYGSGGAIFSADNSSISLFNTTLSGNSAGLYGFAGGIHSQQSSVVNISNSVLLGNIGRYGGGITVDGSSLNVSDSTLSANISGVYGGGISTFDNSSVTVSNSTLSGNSATVAGAISSSGSSLITVNNSTLSDNFAYFEGGAISASAVTNAVRGSSVVVNNSTLSGNSVRYKGGAIYARAASSIVVNNSTLAENLANQAGGIYAVGLSTVSLSNTIVANSVADSECANLGRVEPGIITSDSATIIEDGSCDTGARAVDPILLPLADNGCEVMHATPTGPACVMTHALGAGSPAIDTAIDSDFDTDQIGTPRPQGAAADVGAFELSVIDPNNLGFSVTAVDAIEGEDTNVLFTITLDEPQAVEVGYDFRTEAGSAIDGEDYVGRVGRVFFPVGVTVRERRVAVLEDGVLNEPDETFSMVVTDLNDPSATSITQATINDRLISGATPVISVEQTFARENTERAIVTVALSEPSNEMVIVSYRTVVPSSQNNPATNGGVDYIDRSGRIMFPPGATRRTRTMVVINDDEVEESEVFRFELSDPVNADIAAGSELQRVFILNDD